MLISTQRCGCKESVLISKLPPAQERLSLWPQAPLRGLKTKAVYPQPARLLCPNVCKHGYKAPSTANVYNQGQTTVPTGGQRLKKKKKKPQHTQRGETFERKRLERREGRNGSRVVGSINQLGEGHSSSFVVGPQIFQPSPLTPTPLPHKRSELWRTPIKAEREY